MSWLNWLENRLGFLAIPRLIPAIALLNLFVYILFQIEHDYKFIGYLALDPALILQGQVWRLVSFVFIPQAFLGGATLFKSIFFLLYIWFLIWVGNSLEHAWGAFRVTLYYVLGMVCVALAAFLVSLSPEADNLPIFAIPIFNNLSLFFAFATLFPNVQVYAFLFIPLKVKWMALISLILPLYMFLSAGPLTKVAIVISLMNYVIFFGPMAISNARHSRDVQKRRLKFAAGSVPVDEPLHRCAVCKRSERDDPELEFRVARDGEEYCVEHLPKPVGKS
jgi:hypothetical protein